MKLKDAKLCLNTNCEEVYTGNQCPKCACTYFAYLINWIEPITKDEKMKKMMELLIEQRSNNKPVYHSTQGAI